MQRLEGLPADLIVQVLTCVPSFKKLDSFITTSAICYRLYIKYRHSIDVAIAKNMINPSAWTAATTVIMYQRALRTNTGPGLTLPDFSQIKYIYKDEDKANFTKNQLFFEVCKRDFAWHLELSCQRPHIVPRLDDGAIWPATTTFLNGDELEMDWFYEMWVYSYQFGYDTIQTFARRRCLKDQELSNLLILASNIVYNRYYEEMIVAPMWQDRRCAQRMCYVHPNTLNTRNRGNLFDVWCNNSQVFLPKPNPILWLKLERHLAASFLNPVPRDGNRRFAYMQFRVALEDDYVNETVTLGTILERYTISWC